MITLTKKELISIICSGTGPVFAIIYLIACGSILWIFPGNYNILDNGYAVTDSFYKISSILFLILIPALTMRLLAEEKRIHTLDMLLSRPISIYQILFSKWFATISFIILVLVSTFIYIYTMYILGSPIGNIDLHIVSLTYISLLLLAAVFVAFGILASSLTKNQIIAFVLALTFNFIIFYGFDMIGSLINSTIIKIKLTDYSLSFHTERIRKGVIYLNDILLFSGYLVAAILLFIISLGKKNRLITITLISVSVILFSLSILCPSARLDLSKDKRYTINPISEQLMEKIKKENYKIKVDIYFAGNLNYGLQRLQYSTLDLLNNLNEKAGNSLSFSITDPLSIGISREQLPHYMSERSMPAIQLNEVDRNGKISQQLIYPYAQIIHEQDTLTISLLKRADGNTAEENINASTENLEFQFIDAIQLLTNKNGQDIAFIEGHGELPRASIYDAEEALAKYYNVNRGQITNQISILDNFKVVIIAGPTDKYSETEKFILDQYLMKGGRILWIIDGAYVSYKELREKGESPSIKNDVNLDDLLFNYGVRINSDFVQDAMCIQIPSSSTENSTPINIPWYYSPILLPSKDNNITKDISETNAAFVSSINLVNKTTSIIPKVLLTTANHSHIVRVPDMISLNTEKIQTDKQYFNTSFIPVAISLEGIFKSSFVNRIIPDDIDKSYKQILSNTKPTKMIVISSSDIIKNEIEIQGESTHIIPLGYDRLTGKTFDNKDFIVNTVRWLSNDGDNIQQLRGKSRQMNLLDKQRIYESRNKYAIINLLSPIILILLISGALYVYRKNKYTS